MTPFTAQVNPTPSHCASQPDPFTHTHTHTHTHTQSTSQPDPFPHTHTHSTSQPDSPHITSQRDPHQCTKFPTWRGSILTSSQLLRQRPVSVKERSGQALSLADLVQQVQQERLVPSLLQHVTMMVSHQAEHIWWQWNVSVKMKTFFYPKRFQNEPSFPTMSSVTAIKS